MMNATENEIEKVKKKSSNFEKLENSFFQAERRVAYLSPRQRELCQAELPLINSLMIALD